MPYRKLSRLFFVTFLFVTLWFNVAYAVPSDENYDDDSGFAANFDDQFSNDGITYTMVNRTDSTLVTNDDNGPLGDGGTDYYMNFGTISGSAASLTITAEDDASFYLKSISIDANIPTNETLTITPQGGSGVVLSPDGDGWVTQEGLDFSANSDFYNITSVTISGSFTVLCLDDLNFELPASAVPVISNLNGDSFTYTEGDAATIIDQGTAATVTDSDSSDFNGGKLTVAITSGEDAAEDLLGLETTGVVALAAATAGSNVSVSGSVVGTLGNTIAVGNDLVVNFTTANATPANVQTLLRAVTYLNTDNDAPTTGARTVRTTISDGDGGTSANADVTVTVAGSNDAPVIANLDGDSLTYNEDDAATVIDVGGDATVSDVDTTSNFNGGNLTVTITAGEDAAEDLLGLETTGLVGLAGTIAGSNVTVAGITVGTLGNNIAVGNDLVVNLNTSATLARVQNLIHAVNYRNMDNAIPTTGARTVRTTVNDGDGGTSSAADVTIMVVAVNDDPAIATLPTDVAVTEDTLSNVDLSAATLSDVDSGVSSITLTLSVDSGTLTASSGGSVTVSNSGTAILTLTGTVTNIDTYLNTAANIQYTGSSNTYGNDAATLTLTANDGGATGSGGGGNVTLGTVNLDITGTGDTPSVTSATTDEDTQTTSGLVISRNAVDGAEVTHFKITNISGGTLYKNDGTTAIVDNTFITFAEGNAGLKFTPTANSTSNGSFDIQAGTDGVGGGLSTTSATATITVNAVNDAPVITNLDGDAVTFSIGGNGVALDAGSNATLADIDSADFAGGVLTVAIVTNAQVAEDLLLVGTAGNIATSGANVTHTDGVTIGAFVGGSGGAPLIVTLNSNATLARVRDLISAVQYSNSDAATANTLSRTIILTVNDGDGGSSNSANQSVTVSLLRAPIIDLDGDDSSGAVNGGYWGTFVVGGAAVAVADSDSAISDDGAFKALSLVLTNRPDGVSESLSSTYGSGAQTVNGEAVTIAAYNTATGQLAISVDDGSTDATTMQMLIESIRYNNDSVSPDTTDRLITVTATDNDDNAGANVMATLTIQAPHNVSYDGNDNTDGAVPVDNNDYNASDTVTVLGNSGALLRSGYSFSGWNTAANGSGTTYQQGDTFAMGSEDVTLYARWIENSYSVTYNGNGQSAGEAPTDSNDYNDGDLVTVLDNSGSLSKSGYIFLAWNTSSDGSGSSYQPGDVFAIDASDVILYAQWQESATSTVYFPHVACDGNWQTEICLINLSSATMLTGELHAYAADGSEVADFIEIVLPPHARSEFDVKQVFDQADTIRYLAFVGDDSAVGAYEKFYIDGQYRAAVPAGGSNQNASLLVSHIASDLNWWTGIALLNTGLSEKALTFEFNNGQTATATLAAGEQRAFTIASLLAGEDSSQIQSAVIRNTEEVIGLELFGRDHQLAGLQLNNAQASTIYFPHVASDGTWWTGVSVYNPAASAGNVTLYAYSQEGELIDTQSQTVEGYGTLVGTAQSLNLPDSCAWFKVTADSMFSKLSGLELFGRHDGKQLAGFSSVGLSGYDGILPKIEDEGWTGVAFVNTTEDTALLTLTAYNDAGEIIADTEIQLNGQEKVVDVVENLFGQELDGATYIHYQADQAVAAFQLNSSADGMLLDALPGM
nr:InlB B-repeat-containing protein [uncultured Desulfuromonas sp.]